MSAPDVALKTQKHRHRTIAWGIWIGVGLAALVGVAAGITIFGFGVDPQGAIPPEILVPGS